MVCIAVLCYERQIAELLNLLLPGWIESFRPPQRTVAKTIMNFLFYFLNAVKLKITDKNKKMSKIQITKKK